MVRKQRGFHVTNRPVWDAKEDPWVRRPEAGDQLPCYFCGGNTAIRSFGDRADDQSRLELYCDNDLCDAREAVVLLLRNGQDAHLRADVRALRQVDRGSTPPRDLDIVERQEDRRRVSLRRKNPRSTIVVTEADEDAS
ncbi:hypothetical protein [Streptomyces globisporus]|uniref:hypothetical protein n=1 Tax=Streptomyces globisporus TaxID=1908 RepID=UPI00345FB946|nr:hypothetical protein OG425_35050 [Streptomyces globisporus]WSV94706.1 hypothetical protein OG449_35875 [Streptomyces globisporus]